MRLLVFTLLISCLSSAPQAQPIRQLKITDIEKIIAAKDSGILVINMWATFCKPCVAEIPSFIRITDKYRNDSVKLMLVSLDLPSYYPKKINDFVKKQNFNASVSWLDESNADYFCPRIDKSWSGSIPATLILNTRTGYRKFFEEEILSKDFEEELLKAIKG